MGNNLVTIAQFGCGYWGPNLLRNLVSNKRCRVKTVVDSSKERREYVKGLYPAVAVTGNGDDVINDPEINAVVIATPVQTHFELATNLLKSGKHVLIEKPMARTVDEVKEIGRLADENKLTAMVGQTFLYNAAVRYVKKLIDSGELGAIRYIYSQRLNLGRIRSDVDALWNFAPHDISIIQYWLGDPTPVSIVKHGIDYIQKGIDDVVFLNIIYPDKVMANIHVSWLDPHKIRKITIVGSKKMVVYDDIADNKIAIFDKGIDTMAKLGENMDFDNPNFQTFSHRSGDVLLPKINFQEPLKVEVDHFIDCIIKDYKCLTGPDHALNVVKILSAGDK